MFGTQVVYQYSYLLRPSDDTVKIRRSRVSCSFTGSYLFKEHKDYFYLLANCLFFDSSLLPYNYRVKQEMKFNCVAWSVALVAVSSSVVEGFAFTRTAAGIRSSSSLRMTIEENKHNKEIRVGVIGCGRIGLVHLEAITKAPGCTPVIVSNPTISKAEKGTFGQFVHKFYRNEPMCSLSQFSLVLFCFEQTHTHKRSCGTVQCGSFH